MGSSSGCVDSRLFELWFPGVGLGHNGDRIFSFDYADNNLYNFSSKKSIG